MAYKVYEPKNLGSLSRKADGIDLLHYGANEKFHYAMCEFSENILYKMIFC